MDDNEFYFRKLDDILDRELVDLTISKREHHSSWDNHVLTLSMAAIGFSFTFLSPAISSSLCIFYIAVLSFVISIILAMANYIFADKALEYAMENHTKRRIQHNDIRHRIKQLQKTINNTVAEGDEKTINAEKIKCQEDVDEIIAKRDPDDELKNIKNHNKKINFLNHAKTYFFLTGIISISLFALLNL